MNPRSHSAGVYPSGPPEAVARHVRPTSPPAEAFLAQAQNGVRLAARFLECPTAETLDQSRDCLGVALSQMQACAEVLRAGGAVTVPARAAIQTLKAELDHTTAMFQEASVLFGGWSRLLSAKLSGYTRGGAPAFLGHRHKVVLNG